MKYRINRKTGDRISEIGIGSSYMFEAGMEEAVKALRKAAEGGINYFDLAAGHGDSFPIYGEALHEYRERVPDTVPTPLFIRFYAPCSALTARPARTSPPPARARPSLRSLFHPARPPRPRR